MYHMYVHMEVRTCMHTLVKQGLLNWLLHERAAKFFGLFVADTEEPLPFIHTGHRRL